MASSLKNLPKESFTDIVEKYQGIFEEFAE